MKYLLSSAAFYVSLRVQIYPAISKDSCTQYGDCCEHQFNVREMLLLQIFVLYKLQHICHIQEQGLFTLESTLVNSEGLSSQHNGLLHS